MDGRTDALTDNVKTVYPLQTKFAGGINISRRQNNDELPRRQNESMN